MDSWEQKFKRASWEIQPRPEGLAETYERARRRHRNRRLGAGAVGLTCTVALLAALAAVVPSHAPNIAASTIAFPVKGRVLAARESGSSMWVLTCSYKCSGRSYRGHLQRLDSDTGRVGPTVDLTAPSGLAVDDTGVCVISFEEGTVTHLSVSGDVLSTTHLELPSPIVPGDSAFLPETIAVGEGGVWVASNRGEMARLDPSTGTIERYIPLPPDGLGGNIVAAFGYVWIAEGLVTAKLDPSTNQVVATIPVNQGQLTLAPVQVSVAGSDLWVTGDWARPATDEAGNHYLEATDEWATVSIDPVTGKVSTVASVAKGSTLVAGAGQVWVIREKGNSARQVRDGRLAPTAQLGGRLLAVDSARIWLRMGDGSIVARPAFA